MRVLPMVLATLFSVSHGFSRSALRARPLRALRMAVEARPSATAVRDWRAEVEVRVSSALSEAFGAEFGDVPTMVTPATKPEFGDYQCNVAMSLAKRLGKAPREVAGDLVEALAPLTADAFEAPEIAGPGFINLRFSTATLESALGAMAGCGEGRLGIEAAASTERVVVDFSSPNIAKEMHVGHLRSTIIGDSLARVLEFRGHDVVRLNHVGDWGTQFGMLIAHLKEEAAADGELELSDLVAFYRAAKARFDADEAFQAVARGEVVALQSGEESSLEAWRSLCAKSREQFQVIYDLLDIEVEERGESFYNDMLPGVVAALDEAGLLEDVDGSRAVLLDGVESRDGGKQPYIVQKRDGGFLYSTTDLAAVRQRCGAGEGDEAAQRVLYVTDVGQGSHFDAVFQVARRAGLAPEAARLEHVPFGLVQGEDGKKFKTRSGDTVRLKDLLDEAVRRADADVAERQPELPEEERAALAKAVGLAAVKYADLSMNRESNYRFSYDKMLALNGNTAPYMLYAYARVRGISRKAGEELGAGAGAAFVLAEDEERNLARALLRLPEVLAEVEEGLYPHVLCGWLFETSQRFNAFYESCPIIAAEDEGVRRSRAALAGVTAEGIKLGLGLLGIGVRERI